MNKTPYKKYKCILAIHLILYIYNIAVTNQTYEKGT